MVHTPQGYMAAPGIIKRFQTYNNLHDIEFAQSMGLQPDECITPITPFQKRIFYKVIEFEDLLDSSNIRIEDFVKMADTVK